MPPPSPTAPGAAPAPHPESAAGRPVQRALLSVADKNGIVEFARGLADLGVELVASGGTARALREAGLDVADVAEVTGSPELLGGRVKTLHPAIHAAILARRDAAADRADLDAHAIRPIDLVAVNLYPFEQVVAGEGVQPAEAIEHIDIGGPTMLRAAAKNHSHVAAVTDPTDYPELLTELRARGGGLSAATRQRLAGKVFARCAAYDAAIGAYFATQTRTEPGTGAAKNAPDTATGEPASPPQLRIDLPRAAALRYGENPHQSAALYGTFLEAVAVLHGKELSYNNVVDVQAALQLILDFPAAEGSVVSILKHNTPCGVGRGETTAAAYRNAFASDPDSPFGGIVVSNAVADGAFAAAVDEIFTEVLIAPAFSDEALARLRRKKNRRLLRYREERLERAAPDLRRVFGGLLLQDPDLHREELDRARLVTARKPDPAELRALAFGWRVVKHAKSNAVVFAAPDRTLAIGAGQTSRVDAVLVARDKARRVGVDLRGSALASDAFFPFPDGLEAAADAGASCAVQPGGSTRDAAVTAAADRLGMAMLMTGVRHFRH